MENVVDNNFDLLKKLDNDELYSKTYITLDNLEAIKNKDFQAFSRFKLMGFIDILSKRLELDLSEFRREAEEYFDSIEPIIEKEETNKETLVMSDENKKMFFIIGVITIGIIIVVAIYFWLNTKSTKDVTDIEISPPSSVVITPPIEQIVENNVSLEENITEKNSSIETTKSVEMVLLEKTQKVVASSDTETIKIIPRKSVWIGIMNLDTKEKEEHTISKSEEFVIDKTKNQIIVVDGTYISLMVGMKEEQYNFDGRVRFICKDGKIKEIKFAEFKALNNGKAWK